jgi:tRNA pseudouridine32 synthase / 23S rRNA pseudouridine746 synthase
LSIEEAPALMDVLLGNNLDILYEDEAILVINKPPKFLSVPGKSISDSIYTRVKQSFPYATGPLIVHRLDMATSGIILIAKTKAVHQHLQRQFEKRTIKKRYVAILDGILKSDSGTISLPLRVDLEDRPKQLVCYEYGKSAITRFKVVERRENKTRVHFFPITGRSHQLRVHAAHQNGLSIPIAGDELYGNKNDRLYLHAAYIALQHPLTGKKMSFECKPSF